MAGFLLCGYELLRPTAKDTLLSKPTQKNGLPYINTLVPVGLVVMLYGYGWLLTRCGPRKTLLLTSLLSAIGILGCYLAIRSGSKPARGLLYIIQESLCRFADRTVLVVSGIAASERRPRRKLNGPDLRRCLRWVRSSEALPSRDIRSNSDRSRCFSSVRQRSYRPHSSLIWPIAAVENHSHGGRNRRRTKKKGDYLGIELFGSQPLLILLLLIIITTQVISTTLDLNLQGQFADAIPNADARNAKLGEMYALLNSIAAVSQFVVSPLLLYMLPLAVIHVGSIPLLNTVAACGYLLRHPSLSAATTAYITFKVIDYSLFRSAKEILYIPFSFDVRYRAKELIDVWGYRFQ